MPHFACELLDVLTQRRIQTVHLTCTISLVLHQLLPTDLIDRFVSMHCLFGFFWDSYR